MENVDEVLNSKSLALCQLNHQSFEFWVEMGMR